jgi:hypothetical protein
MKPSVLILLILFSLKAFSQSAYSFKCPIKITIYDKSKKGKVHADDCRALLIIGKDTIETHPNAVYNIEYPPKNIQLIIKYKEWTKTINCDKYLELMFSKYTVYISILLDYKNNTGEICVEYGGSAIYADKYECCEKSKHCHNVSFTTYPAIYPIVK